MSGKKGGNKVKNEVKNKVKKTACLIACFYELEEWEQEFFRKKLGKKFELRFFEHALVEENVGTARDATVIGVFVFSKLSKQVLQKLPRLELIAAMSTGFDHVDLSYCKKHGVSVCNVPSYGENTVAEHTFALLLALSRKIHKAWEKTTHADFTLDGLRGWDLQGKTIGVVGTGKIGQHVIRIAKGFEMKVIAFDAFPQSELAEELGFKYVSFNDLMRSSDVVTLHAPLTPKTRHFINKRNYRLFKKNAVLINTARGALVDTHALLAALREGVLSGAALDVLENEEAIKEEKELIYRKTIAMSREEQQTLLDEHVLLNMNNVIVTPHCAFNSIEALQRILDTTLENIEAFTAGKPRNKVC